MNLFLSLAAALWIGNAGSGDDGLSYRATDFGCVKDYKGEGYRLCTVDIAVEVSAARWVSGNPAVECEAQVDFRSEKGGFRRRVRDDARKRVRVSRGSGRGRISVKVDVASAAGGDPVVDVKPRHVRCQIRPY